MVGDLSNQNGNVRTSRRRSARTEPSSIAEEVGPAIESEGEERLTHDNSGLEDSIAMANNVEVMKEMTTMMTSLLSRQLENQRQQNKESEEATMGRFKQILEGQAKFNKENTEIIASEFENIRKEREISRASTIQKLPIYDGANLEIDEWQDRCEAILLCNKWDVKNMLSSMPISLSGMAKRAFDSLLEDDKETKDIFFSSMRQKIDPQSKKKNKELFIMAKKASAESVTSFVDRCRMYVRRAGNDPNEPFTVDMLKLKVYDSLSTTDRKILKAAMGLNENLDSLVEKADSMLGSQVDRIGAVFTPEIESQNNWREMANDMVNGAERARLNQVVVCYKCNKPGHVRRECRRRITPDQGNSIRFNGNEGNLGANSYNFQPGFDDFNETAIMPLQQSMTHDCNNPSQTFMPFHSGMPCPANMPFYPNPIRPPMSGDHEEVVTSPHGNIAEKVAGLTEESDETKGH